MLSPTTLQPFKTLLRKHLPSFHSSPCLLITSSPPIDTVQTNSKIDDFVRSTAQLLLSQNIRSIPITIDAAYPTKQKIQESLMLAQRAGVKDGIVLGVGSGPAMDLAKALSVELYKSDNSGRPSLILAPATLGGMYAATSRQALFLDVQEEMLLPQCGAEGEAEITFDAKYFSCAPLITAKNEVSMAHIAAATLVMALDVARIMDCNGVNNDKKQQLKAVTSLCVSVLNAASSESSDYAESRILQNQLIEAMLQLSAIQEYETIPQTLANALLPTYFPQSHIFTYLSCILPGLCETFDSNGIIIGDLTQSILDTQSNESITQAESLPEWASAIIKRTNNPTMASLAYGTPDVKTLLNKVDDYATLRGMGDNLYLIGDVLERSLNR